MSFWYFSAKYQQNFEKYFERHPKVAFFFVVNVYRKSSKLILKIFLNLP